MLLGSACGARGAVASCGSKPARECVCHGQRGGGAAPAVAAAQRKVYTPGPARSSTRGSAEEGGAAGYADEAEGAGGGSSRVAASPT